MPRRQFIFSSVNYNNNFSSVNYNNNNDACNLLLLKTPKLSNCENI